MMKIVSPTELHTRAIQNGVTQTPTEELPFYETVSKFINGSQGCSRAQIPLRGKLTSEYCIIPMPSSIVDDEGVRVRDWLRDKGFYATMRADSLARFKEEALLIVCWDPKVIAEGDSDEDSTDGLLNAHQLYCVLPGKEGKLCNHCYQCHNADSAFVPPKEGLR